MADWWLMVIGAHPICKVFFHARVMVFCLRENTRIIFGYWLPKNCANFSWVGGNFCVFRFSHLVVLVSKFLFSVVTKVANIPLFLVVQITIHHLYYNVCVFRHLTDWNLLQCERSQSFLDHAWEIQNKRDLRNIF